MRAGGRTVVYIAAEINTIEVWAEIRIQTI